MHKTRRLLRAALLGISTTLLFVLAGGTAAWARPLPFDPEPGPAVGGGAITEAAAQGTSLWALFAVGLASAAVAAAVTLIAAHLVSLHRRVTRSTTTA